MVVGSWWGEECTVSSLVKDVFVPTWVPDPIPGARLSLLPALTTLSISGVSSKFCFALDEGTFLSEPKDGIVLPLCRVTKGDGRDGRLEAMG